MGDRAKALTITFADIGKGSVVRDIDPESLAQPNDSGVFSPTLLTQSANIDLFEGLAIRRDGTQQFSTVEGSNVTITGLFPATFDPGKRIICAGYVNAKGNGDPGGSGGAVEVYDEANSTWIVITPTGGRTGNLVTNQPWRFAMVPRAADVPANQLIFGGLGIQEVYLWNGDLITNGAVALDQVNNPGSPRTAKFYVSFLSRAMALNTIDSDGNSHPTRITFSIVGDSTNWIGLGSGTINLDRDPFPIAAGAVMGGRLVVLKGGPDGGALYVLTPTGIAISPMRVDAINPDTGVGVLVPRSFIPIAPGAAFFLGHDAAYLYDGVAALQPFALGVARDIRSRINKKVLDTGFALYNHLKDQIELHIPVGSSLVPNEVWTFDTRSRRAWGPHSLAKKFFSGMRWLPQGTLSWNTWGQAEPPDRTWANIVDTNADEYLQWDLIGTGLGTDSIIYGSNDGLVYKSEGTESTDGGTTGSNGTPIVCTIDLPPITPGMWMKDRQTGERYKADDVFVLRSVTLRLRSSSTTAWIPVVSVTTDGTVYDTISDGVSQGPSGADRLFSATYYPDNTIDPGVWHQIRITNSSGDPFSLKDIQCEFTFAGNLRHE